MCGNRVLGNLVGARRVGGFVLRSGAGTDLASKAGALTTFQRRGISLFALNATKPVASL
jgi:hypothetical protein